MKTLTVDDYNRVRLPDVNPRHVFAREKEASGRIILTPLAPVEPKPAKVRFEKRGRYTVDVLDREINGQAIKEALADFPNHTAADVIA
jgi:hypothetical protein